MQTNRLAVEDNANSDSLLVKLDEAIERARSWSFDLPSEPAVDSARALFFALRDSQIDLSALDVSIAADGAIAIAASNGKRSAVVELDPETGDNELVVSNESQKRVVKTSKRVSNLEIVREFERAA